MNTCHTTPYFNWESMTLYTLLCYHWQWIHATPHHILPKRVCLCIHYYVIIDNKYMHTTPYFNWESMTLYTLLCYHWQWIHATPHHILPESVCLCIHYYVMIDNKYMPHHTIFYLREYVFVYITMLSLTINMCHTTPYFTWESMSLYTLLCYHWQ